MLSRPGLGDDAGLAHALGQERLPHHLVALMGAAVHEILALEEDAGIPVTREVVQLGDGGGPPQVAGEELVQLGGEGWVGLRLDEGVLELVKGWHQQLGHELSAVGAEVGGKPRVAMAGVLTRLPSVLCCC